MNKFNKKNLKQPVILNLIQDPYNVKSHQNGFRIRSGMTQCGRSMVEMLGVLAVMGVLSVGGVAMYTNAMNKYRANEILNEASKRAVMVAGQLLTNPSATTMPLSQFGPNTVAGATFGENATISNGKITLTVSGVETAICNQMIAATGTNSAMQVASGCGTITFNTDMSKGNSTSETAAAECDPACQTGEECVGGACVTITPDTSNGCSKNADCDTWCDNNNYDKCYCQISADYLGNDSACYNNFTGTCAQASTKSGISGGYMVSYNRMSWWSAVNFCKAHNKSLVSLSSLGITGGYNSNARCHASECTDKDGNAFNWSDLRSKIIDDEYYWLKDAVSCNLSTSGCTAGSNNNSCNASAMDAEVTGVGSNRRNRDDYYLALCK